MRPARFVNITLLALVISLQIDLWAGDGSMATLWQLRQSIEAQQLENEKLQARNQRLAAEVTDLKTGLETVEATARREFGMVGSNETFFHVVRD